MSTNASVKKATRKILFHGMRGSVRAKTATPVSITHPRSLQKELAVGILRPSFSDRHTHRIFICPTEPESASDKSNRYSRFLGPLGDTYCLSFGCDEAHRTLVCTFPSSSSAPSASLRIRIVREP